MDEQAPAQINWEVSEQVQHGGYQQPGQGFYQDTAQEDMSGGW